MKISVIIPTLNEAAGIRTLLQSLEALRSHGHEILVVDGGSEDDTCRQAEQLADQVIVSSPGRAQQMNCGASNACGDWLWFLHADSHLNADVIGQLQLAVNSTRQWGWFNVRLSGRHPLLFMVAKFMNARARLTRIATGDMGIFVEKSLFNRAGRFAEIALMEDIRLSRELKRLDWHAYICEGSLVTSSRRWETHGIIKTIVLMWRLRFLYWIGVSPTRLSRLYRR